MQHDTATPLRQADMPLVSLLVPTIGRPRYIVDTVRSILAQTYPNLQILISDNAAVVASAPLFSQAGIADPRIEIIERTERLGFSAHMNACIDAARGTFVMILSDDDQITPNYVAEMVEMMAADRRVTVCLGRQARITEHDCGLVQAPAASEPRCVIDGVEFLKGTISGTIRTNVMTYISMFVRREDLLRVGGFRDYPDGSHADNFIVFSLALRGSIALGTSVMCYRVYLASSGLKTPFQALLDATRAYTLDCSGLIREQNSVTDDDKRYLVRLLHSSNSRLLLSRIRHVYWHQLSASAILGCLWQVARFRFQRMPPL